MEYPKKFTRTGDNPPDIIVRGSGESGSIKIVEYQKVRTIGRMCVYKGEYDVEFIYET